MKPASTLAYEFVEFIPETIDEGVLYISLEYATASHKCCCGCGNPVVTPLSPVDWKLVFDGSVSLYPSIGNWGFNCKSHYWIRNNEVEWAPVWSEKEIDEGRDNDRHKKKKRFRKKWWLFF